MKHGAMYRIEQQEELKRHLQEILPVARYIEKHYAESISMSEMARARITTRGMT